MVGSFSPILLAITLMVLLPDAICSIMLLTSVISENSCISRFLVSSYIYPFVLKNRLIIFSSIFFDGSIIDKYFATPPVIP